MIATSTIERDRADDICRPAPPATVAAAPAAPAKIDDLELYSEQVQEVLGAPPHWLVHWGITVIFLILALLLALSWIIRYPDVVLASVVVTTAIPPSAVIAQASGDLINIRVGENERVERGALLAVIQNSANPAAVFQLQERLSVLGTDLEHPALSLDFTEHLPLGELQGVYSTFIKNYKALCYYIEEDPAGQEIRTLEPQLARYRERLQGYQQQANLLAREIELADRTYRRARELSNRKVLPAQDLDDKERELLQTRRALETAQIDIANTRLDIGRLEQDLAQLRIRDRQQRQDLRLALAESYKNLSSQLVVWERTYVLRAPIDGVVSLFRFWSDHQFVKVGDEVLTIVPDGNQAPVGRVMMPLANSGKVKPGHAVYIRLDNYPYQEFGLLRGVVKSISPVPREARYAIEVALPAALETTFGKRLDFRQEMQGRAEIVTEDLRLLERIFYRIRKLLIGDADRRGS
jgi:multidrug resistance efflux pump